MEVVLARGRFCYSGIGDTPPDMLHEGNLALYNQAGQASDDDYSSDDSHPERTARRREKRAKRKGRRSERRELRRNFLNAAENKWRLIIVHRPDVIV